MDRDFFEKLKERLHNELLNIAAVQQSKGLHRSRNPQSRKQNEDDQIKSSHQVSANDWRISQISIYNEREHLIYNHNFGSSLREFDSALVSKLNKTINEFAHSSFDCDTVSLKIAGEVLLCFDEKDFKFVIAIIPGTNVPIGSMSHLNNSLMAMVSMLSNILSLHKNDDQSIVIDPEINEMVTNQIRILNKAHTPLYIINKIEDFTIDFVVITKSTGVPLTTRVYEGRAVKDDPILVSMFLHSIQIFFEANFVDELQSIQFSDRILFFNQSNDFYYGILIRFFHSVPVSLGDPINLLGQKLITILIESLSLLGDLEKVRTEVLHTVVDTFVFECIQDSQSKYQDFAAGTFDEDQATDGNSTD